jgi:hypothetical protein
MKCGALLLCGSAAALADGLHPSMIPVAMQSRMSLVTDDEALQGLHERGMRQLQRNLKEFAPGMKILVEGGGYDNAWLETQPMGGEMYARHDLQVALNNQVLFLRAQRADGRLPGMVIPGSMVAKNGWQEKGFPAAHEWKKEHGIVADYEMFQGYCFPEPAFRMYHLTGKNREYLKQLATALARHDAYLWQTRDSNNDGLLETWCVWDTGEDGSTRLERRGARHNWPFEQAPGSGAPGLPALPQGHRMPFQSMDIMGYSYSGREVLARIARELDNGEEKKWRAAAEEVRRRVIDKLWDPARHACFDRDREGKFLPELIHNNLRCMWFGLFTQEMADAFIRHHLLNPEEFWTPVPLPSIARNESLFLSDPRNNWSGQPQGLTYQRAIHALERYGHHAEVALLGRALLPVLIRNGTFPQQLDPETGKPSLSNADGYGPMILALQEYVARMHGICLDPENGRIWWSGLSPASWGAIPDPGDDSPGSLAYTQKWGDHMFAMKLRRKGGLTAIVDGKEIFTANKEVRVVTDLQGKVLSLVGVDSIPREAHLEQAGQRWTGPVSPNEVWNCTPDGLVLARKAPFDFPYQRPGS